MIFQYTLSCIYLSSLLDISIKNKGFKKLILDYDSQKGHLFFSKPIDDFLLSDLKKLVGITFVHNLTTYSLQFYFFKSESFYYNYIEQSSYDEPKIINHDDPFRIKTFTCSTISENQKTSVMLQQSHYIHIMGYDQDIFIYSKICICDVCQKFLQCLFFQYSCHLCIHCIQNLFKTLLII